MPHLPTSVFGVAVIAIAVGGVAFTAVSYADTPVPQTAMEQPPSAKPPHDEKRIEHLETRIKTLHDKLGVTAEQEAKWAVVTQTMRDNEDSIGQLMKQRYDNRKTMTAVDDLQSYETIAEAHTNGLKKLIPVFQDLYADMSDAQKKDADQAFGQFEGHRDGKSAPKHG